MKIYRSFSSEETKMFADGFAKKINHNSRIIKRKYALVIALVGELGAGKTTFVQGFFKGLGLKKTPPSPTFIIMRRTPLYASTRASAGRRLKKFKNVFHIDAYRIKNPRDLIPLEFEKIFRDSRNIVLIEWAENIKKILPENTIWLKFHHGKKENERKIAYNIVK